MTDTNPSKTVTPLKRVRGLGSAKTGTEHFTQQRITAFALLPLTLYFLWVMMQLIGAPYEDVVACFKKPSVAILFLLFLWAGFYHMKLGMQIIIEDYVHGSIPRKIALLANTFFVSLMAAACGFAILKLAFGG